MKVMMRTKANNFVSIMTVVLFLFSIVEKQHNVSGNDICTCTNTSVALSNCTEFRCPCQSFTEYSFSRNLSCLCSANTKGRNESACLILTLNQNKYTAASCQQHHSFICVDDYGNFQIYSERNLTWEGAVNFCIERNLYIQSIENMSDVNCNDDTAIFWSGQFFGFLEINTSAKCIVEKDNVLEVSTASTYITSVFNLTSDSPTTVWTNSSLQTTTSLNNNIIVMPSSLGFITSEIKPTSTSVSYQVEPTSTYVSYQVEPTSTSVSNQVEPTSTSVSYQVSMNSTTFNKDVTDISSTTMIQTQTSRPLSSSSSSSDNTPSQGSTSIVSSFPTSSSNSYDKYTLSTTLGKVHSSTADILSSYVSTSVSATTAQSSESGDHGDNKGSNIGVIIGSVIGVVAVIAIAVFVILFKRRTAKKKSKDNSVPMADIVSISGYTDTSLKGQNKVKRSHNPIYLPKGHIPDGRNQNEDEGNYDHFQSKQSRPMLNEENETYDHMPAKTQIDDNEYGMLDKRQGRKNDDDSNDVYDHTGAVGEGIYDSNSTKSRPLTDIYDSTIALRNVMNADDQLLNNGNKESEYM